MKRSLLLACILACVVVLVLVAWLMLLPGVPKYKGKPLTEWIKDGYGTTSTREQLGQANEAVRSVGTNALDFWVTMLGSTNDSKFTEIVNSISIRGKGFHLQDAADRCYIAFCALYILGPDAKPAIPKLRELLDYRLTQPNAYATIILAGLGPEGAEILTNTLADSNRQMRSYIAGTLGGWNGKPPNYNVPTGSSGGPWAWPEPVMKAFIPALVRCLKDQDENVRVVSAEALGFMSNDAATSIPALAEYLAGETNAVGRTIGLEALARFGKASKPAWSEITRFLKDSDFQTRRSATNALKKIDPKAAAQAGVK